MHCVRRQNPPNDPGPPEDEGERRLAERSAPAGDAAPARPKRPRVTRAMHVAFIGFGLIGGSIARAVRAGTTECVVDDGRLVADRGRVRRRRSPMGSSIGRRRPRPTRSPTPTWSCSPDRRRPAWRPSTSSRARGARPSPPGAVITDVASTKAASAGAGRCRRPALSSAATRWPVWTRAGMRRAAPTCSWVDPGSSSPAASLVPTDVARVASLAAACGARVIELDAADTRSCGGGDQPPAAGARGGARRGRRR